VSERLCRLALHAAPFTRAAPVATTAKSDGAELEQHETTPATRQLQDVRRKNDTDLKSWQALRIDHFGTSDEAYLQAETSQQARAKETAEPPFEEES
jgi:hypothetical protein